MVLIKLLFLIIGLCSVQPLTKQYVLLSQLLNFSIFASLKVISFSVVMVLKGGYFARLGPLKLFKLLHMLLLSLFDNPLVLFFEHFQALIDL